MNRSEIISILLSNFPDSKFISTIGNTSKELYNIKDQSNNFYMLGSMGLASSFGFGIALGNKKKHIIVLDGDGSILMNLGSLTTIGSYNLSNYLLVIFDNGVYETTGCQKTNTSSGTKLQIIANGSNCSPVYYFNNNIKKKEFDDKIKYIKNGVLIIKIDLVTKYKNNIKILPNNIINRFMKDVQKIK